MLGCLCVCLFSCFFIYCFFFWWLTIIIIFSNSIGTDPRDKIYSDVMKRSEVKSRWCKTQILVIDEISMLSAETFDVLSFIGKYCLCCMYVLCMYRMYVLCMYCMYVLSMHCMYVLCMYCMYVLVSWYHKSLLRYSGYSLWFSFLERFLLLLFP